MRTLLSRAMVLAFALGATPSLAADKAVKGPNGLSLNCTDFTRHEDGSWSSGPEATVNYPDKPGSFANIADARGIEMYDVQLGPFLDENCR
jgi:hypothetical protein